MYDSDLAGIYDDLYAAGLGKDYPAEAAAIAGLIRDRHPDADSLLDVGCGTATHLAALSDLFTHVEGVEPSPAMRAHAQPKLSGVTIHDADMRTLHLDRTFSAVTCLFSTIGYAVTAADLTQTVARLAHHVEPGGVLLIEPWFTPIAWTDNHVGTTVATTDRRTIVRMSHGTRSGRVSTMRMHYLVAEHNSPDGIRHFSDEHLMGLHTLDEYRAALEAAGLVGITAVDGWATGRERLIGIKA